MCVCASVCVFCAQARAGMCWGGLRVVSGKEGIRSKKRILIVCSYKLGFDI